MLRSIATRCASWKAIIQILINLTIPIRLAYGKDRAKYAVACDEEACAHYGVTLTQKRQLLILVAGFFQGVTIKDIPEWFTDGWFRQSTCNAVKPFSLRFRASCHVIAINQR